MVIHRKNKKMTEIAVRIEDSANQAEIVRRIEKKGVSLAEIKNIELEDGDFWTFIFVTTLSLSEAGRMRAAWIIKNISGVEDAEISF
jgi:hypothetical protein